MSKIEVTETGEVNLESIERLSRDELQEWIGECLRGEDVQVPIDFREGDRYYDLIELLYPRLKRSVREDIQSIVLENLEDLARNPESPWRGEAGDELLLLAQSLCGDEIFDLLVEMAISQRLFAADEAAAVIDLHYRVLQTLVALGYRGAPEFWRAQARLRPDRYAGVTFSGLAIIAPAQAIDWLAEIEWTDAVEDRILWALPGFVDRGGLARMAALVERSWLRLPPRAQFAFRQFFAEEGHPLETEDRVLERAASLVESLWPLLPSRAHTAFQEFFAGEGCPLQVH
jgi:hypothetical protein